MLPRSPDGFMNPAVRQLLTVARVRGGLVRLGNLRAAATALRLASAAAPATWLRVGDSTTVGLGAGSATTWTGAAQRNASFLLAGQSSGDISNDSFIGDAWGGAAPGYSVYNPNVTLGLGWATNTGTLGGFLFKFTAGGTGTLRMAIPGGTATVRIYFVRGGATATVQTDLGVVGTMAAGSTAVIIQDFPVQANAAYIEVASPSTTHHIVGMAAINPTQKVLLLNAGINGGKVADFTATLNTFDPLSTLKTIAPSLTEINLTINDSNAPTARDTYKASLVTLVEGALISGSVVLKIGAVSNAASSTNGVMDGIHAAAMEVASTYDLTVLSTPAAIGRTYPAASGSGYMFDSFHPNYTGYGKEVTECQLRLLAAIRKLA